MSVLDLTAYHWATMERFDEYLQHREGQPLIAAVLCLASAIEDVAYQLRQLGNAGANTPMGAIEALGAVVKDGTDAIADALREGR